MKISVRMLTVLLAVLMLGASVTVAQAATPDAVTQPQVAQRLDLLMEQLGNRYFTVSQKASTSSGDANQCGMVKVLATDWMKEATNGMIPKSLYTASTFTHYFNGGTWVRGMSCCGFANYAQWYLFAQDSADVVKTREVAFVEFEKANMLKYAQPGDVIRLGNTTSSGDSTHSAVIYSINDNSVTVVDCNWDSPKCKVTKHSEISYSKYKYAGITRAANYEYPTGWYTIDIADDSEGLIQRSGPASSYTQLQRVPDNARVKVIDTVGTWGQYVYNGTLGWSNMDYMAFTGTYVDTVTFDANGGSGTMNPIYFDVGTGFKAPACAFTMPGYRFLGWTLTNTDVGKWRCVSADGATYEWLTEQEAAEKGYRKFLYAEGVPYNRSARIDKGASYRMVAQWEQDSCEAPAVTVSNRASDGKPVLKWNAVDGAVKYEVYRATSQTGEYRKLTTVTGTKLTNTSTVANTGYYYKVRAIDSSGMPGEYSTVLYCVCDCAKPVVTAGNRAGDGKPVLKWNAVEGAVKYEVYRATSKTGEYKKLTTITGTKLYNTSAVNGTTYYYKVRALGSNSEANSAFSSVVSRACDYAQPKVTVKLNSSGKPVLTWAAVTGATKYQVYRSVDGSSYSLLKTMSGTKLTNTSAVSGNTYYYKVRALGSNSSSTSAYSPVVSITSK